MRVRRAIGAVVAAALASAALGTSGGAAEAQPSAGAAADEVATTVELDQGAALPIPTTDRFQHVQVIDATDGYVLHDRWRDDGSGRWFGTITDARDGSTVRTVPMVRYAGQAALAGESYLLPQPDVWSSADSVEVRSVATGELTHTFDVGGRPVLLADEHWVLVEGGADAVFLWDDGRQVPVSGMWLHGDDVEWRGSLLVAQGDTILDPMTGEQSHLVLPGGAWARVLGASGGRTYGVSGTGGSTLWWWDDPAGPPTGSVSRPAPFKEIPVVTGDGVAVLTSKREYTEGLELWTLSALDVETGAAGTTLIDDVFWWQQGDTALYVATASGGPGTVWTVDEAGVARVTDLPPVEQLATFVGLVDGRATAWWSKPHRDESNGAVNTGLWQSRLGDPWAPAYPEIEPPSSAYPAGPVAKVARRAVLAHAEERTMRVVTADGKVRPDATDLSRDGRYFLRAVRGGWHVRSVATGDRLLRVQDRGRFSGRWYWTGPDATGLFRAVDVRGRLPDRRVRPRGARTISPRVDRCSLWDVRGDMALLRCGDMSGWVLDLRREMPAWRIPPERLGLAFLGHGYVTWLQGDVGVVADLSRAHTTRRFGPLTTAPIWPMATNVGPRPDLLYVDEIDQVRHLTLDWLAPPRS